ncbi:hypothetical protein EVAR_82898_1 [Eumeta japonica]|uniref:Uncharacterized protein n=1 Tax=Eumeta variegata TaxID=151549 RepID=A0A4C1YGM5_EUMVA|nr:hypothetical protein EVAR_82898_1 [Eumeta japonica]
MVCMVYVSSKDRRCGETSLRKHKPSGSIRSSYHKFAKEGLWCMVDFFEVKLTKVDFTVVPVLSGFQLKTGRRIRDECKKKFESSIPQKASPKLIPPPLSKHTSAPRRRRVRPTVSSSSVLGGAARHIIVRLSNWSITARLNKLSTRLAIVSEKRNQFTEDRTTRKTVRCFNCYCPLRRLRV